MNSEIAVPRDHSIIQILILNCKFDFVPISAAGKLLLKMLCNSRNSIQDFLGKTSFITKAKTTALKQNLILKHTSIKATQSSMTAL